MRPHLLHAIAPGNRAARPLRCTLRPPVAACFIPLLILLLIPATAPRAADTPRDSVLSLDGIVMSGESSDPFGKTARMTGFRLIRVRVRTAAPARRFFALVSPDSGAAPYVLPGAMLRQLREPARPAVKKAPGSPRFRLGPESWFELRSVPPREPVPDALGRVDCEASALVDPSAAPPGGGPVWITLYSEEGVRLAGCREEGAP